MSSIIEFKGDCTGAALVDVKGELGEHGRDSQGTETAHSAKKADLSGRPDLKSDADTHSDVIKVEAASTDSDQNHDQPKSCDLAQEEELEDCEQQACSRTLAVQRELCICPITLVSLVHTMMTLKTF